MRHASGAAVRRSRIRPFHLLIVGTVFLSSSSHAQVASSRPAVFLREVRIDSMLLVFGVDSTRVRAAVMEALRDAHRLAPHPRNDVPALDVDLTAMRSAIGWTMDPRGFVRVEVGRNLVESGAARRLVWEGMQDLTPSPTWRELSRGALATVLRVVNNYLLGRSGGV